jgi:hypothetical protein
MESTPKWEPPMAGSEGEHLFAILDRLRTTFRYKADGLSLEQLKARIPSSTLSLGGLLQHLALVEDEKFTWLISSQRPEILLELTKDGRDQFEVMDEASEVYELYDKAVARSRSVQQQILADGRLDTPSSLEFEGETASVRRIICDLIEEYGRHTGHADLLREAIDGRVGEDPPRDYQPNWY